MRAQELDSDGLRRQILRVPGELGIWRAGPEALDALLYRAALERLLDIAAALNSGSTAEYATVTDRWRHATAALVEWHFSHAGPTSRPAQDQDVQAGVSRAVSWRELEAISSGLASGDMTIVSASGRDIELGNSRDHAVEVLDILLEQVTVPEPSPLAPSTDEVAEWFTAHSGRADLVQNIPADLEQALYHRALHELTVRGLTLPATTDLGGISLGDARSCYATLLARAELAMLCTTVLLSPLTPVWRASSRGLATALASRTSRGAAEAFIDIATFSPGRAAGSAPLIPASAGNFYIPQALLSHVGFERTMLRAASSDPARAGRLGNVLGKRSGRWTERLKTVPGVLVAERLDVPGPDGRPVGDLDVVAWDPAERVALIVEAKWPVDAHTLQESAKVDATFDAGRSQVSRLRAALSAGAEPRWPAGWNVGSDAKLVWWVGSAQQLDSRPGRWDDEVRSTSLRLIEQLLPATSLLDLMRRLEEFPLPREGFEYEIARETARAGKYRLSYPALAILGDPPQPPGARRTADGWT